MASDPRPRRYGLKLSAHETDRFLKALTETGNLTLAADRVGRHRSTFVKRCTRDPAFAARCGTAVAEFRLNHAPSAGSSVQRGLGGGAGLARSAGPLKCTRGDLVLAHGKRRPAQIRRAGGGELTQAGIDAFLQTLAATANVRLSAESVGVRPNAIRQRRRRDPAFDQAVGEALRTGYDRLEAALLESAIRSLDPDEEHEEWLERNGGAVLPRMDIDQAMMLLAQRRRTCREGWETQRARETPADWEDVERYFSRQLRLLGAEIKDGEPSR